MVDYTVIHTFQLVYTCGSSESIVSKFDWHFWVTLISKSNLGNNFLEGNYNNLRNNNFSPPILKLIKKLTDFPA